MPFSFPIKHEILLRDFVRLLYAKKAILLDQEECWYHDRIWKISPICCNISSSIIGWAPNWHVLQELNPLTCNWSEKVNYFVDVFLVSYTSFLMIAFMLLPLLIVSIYTIKCDFVCTYLFDGHNQFLLDCDEWFCGNVGICGSD